MKKEVLSNWWRLNTTDADMKIIRWGVPIMCVVVCSAMLSQLQAAQFARAAGNLGLLMMFVPYALGPQCLGVFEAAPGSNSRKALTTIALIGFMLNLSSLLSKYLSL